LYDVTNSNTFYCTKSFIKIHCVLYEAYRNINKTVRINIHVHVFNNTGGPGGSMS